MGHMNVCWLTTCKWPTASRMRAIPVFPAVCEEAPVALVIKGSSQKNAFSPGSYQTKALYKFAINRQKSYNRWSYAEQQKKARFLH